jgi:hypothetical protein
MTRLALILLTVGLLASPRWLPAQASNNTLKLGTAAASQGAPVSLPLTLSTTDEVQGLVAVFEWEAAVGSGEDLVIGAALTIGGTRADTIVTRVANGFMVLGVVVDANGTPPAFIPPGNNLDIATAKIRCATGGAEDTTTAVRFVDDKYASVEGGPLLDNLVSVGGLSITRETGLVLTDGSFTCRVPAGRVVFKVENGTAGDDGCGRARVLMDSDLPIQGYVVALSHPAALDLTGAEAGTAATQNGADFIDTELLAAGGVVAVVLDLVEPFSNNTIPPGENLEIARYSYCCKSRPSAPDPAAVHPLTFVDNALGTPAKENVAVAAGLSLAPELQNGSFTCPPIGPREVCNDGIDNDGDQKIDCDDEDCANAPECLPPGQAPMFACGGGTLGPDGTPVVPRATVGGSVDICFYYKSPEDNAPGHQQFDQIQGLSMAVCYPCDLTCREGTFTVAGTIVEAVGADFISHQCDNDPADGDGCELIIGILVDSLPPFDGATLPPTDRFEKVGCITFGVANRADLCGKCLPITFCDGADGRGKVPIKNLIATENESRKPALMDCEVCILGQPTFHRGDCNSSSMGNMSVDIADAAATISFLFQRGTWKYTPACLDACDCNDDGRVDLADATCILSFLFQFGPFPPAPGPGFDMNGNDQPAGPDPTDDKLDCRAEGGC